MWRCGFHPGPNCESQGATKIAPSRLFELPSALETPSTAARLRGTAPSDAFRRSPPTRRPGDVGGRRAAGAAAEEHTVDFLRCADLPPQQVRSGRGAELGWVGAGGSCTGAGVGGGSDQSKEM